MKNTCKYKERCENELKTDCDEIEDNIKCYNYLGFEYVWLEYD